MPYEIWFFIAELHKKPTVFKYLFILFLFSCYFDSRARALCDSCSILKARKFPIFNLAQKH